MLVNTSNYKGNHGLRVFTVFQLLRVITGYVYLYMHIVLCFCFICFRFVFPMLPVFLDCQFLIVPSVFSKTFNSYYSFS